jgi:hypothetical protein
MFIAVMFIAVMFIAMMFDAVMFIVRDDTPSGCIPPNNERRGTAQKPRCNTGNRKPGSDATFAASPEASKNLNSKSQQWQKPRCHQ